MDREEPFHCTVEPLEKPDPSTVILNAGPAAATWLGEIELTFAVQPARTSTMAGGKSKPDGPPRNLHPPRFAIWTSRADISNSLRYILVSSPPGRSPGRGQSSVALRSVHGKWRGPAWNESYRRPADLSDGCRCGCGRECGGLIRAERCRPPAAVTDHDV